MLCVCNRIQVSNLQSKLKLENSIDFDFKSTDLSTQFTALNSVAIKSNDENTREIQLTVAMHSRHITRE